MNYLLLLTLVIIGCSVFCLGVSVLNDIYTYYQLQKKLKKEVR